MPNFYEEIPAFKNFEDIQDTSFFQQAPADWLIVVTDIKGSTKAANEGRGKEVNMLGAAVIALLSNFVKSLKIPFVFGGDGATLLMPQAVFDEFRPSLVGLMRLAKSEFRLDLRVGVVAVADLLKDGFPVLVGKYETSTNSQFAQFLGAGFSEAEMWVKRGSSKAQILNLEEKFIQPSLNGLSCRLTPFLSKKGVIATIIVKSLSNDNSAWIRGTLLAAIKGILNGDLNSASPVTKEALKWAFLPKTLKAELALAPKGLSSFVKVISRILLANTLLKLNINAGGFVPKRYKSEVSSQSDFNKFDDNLRMVIDCSAEQVQAIEDLLKDGKAQGLILYGLHKSKTAIVTCIVHSASDGEHIHFVDGENCGYTQAATQMKKDLA
jgi:hypothetical protein